MAFHLVLFILYLCCLLLPSIFLFNLSTSYISIRLSPSLPSFYFLSLATLFSYTIQLLSAIFGLKNEAGSVFLFLLFNIWCHLGFAKYVLLFNVLFSFKFHGLSNCKWNTLFPIISHLLSLSRFPMTNLANQQLFL